MQPHHIHAWPHSGITLMVDTPAAEVTRSRLVGHQSPKTDGHGVQIRVQAKRQATELLYAEPSGF
jgi:hypothetical protein